MRRSTRLAIPLLVALTAFSVIALRAAPPARADSSPGVPAGSGSLQGTERVDDGQLDGSLCIRETKSIYALRGVGSYQGRTPSGQVVVYQASIDPNTQTLYDNGPIQLEVESTQTYYQGPFGTHGTSDATCAPATAGTPVPAEFRIFAADHIYVLDATGAQSPCKGHGTFARGDPKDLANSTAKVQAQWSLDADCTVVGNAAGTPGTGIAPAYSPHTYAGTHNACFSPPCANNIQVSYSQYFPFPGLHVGVSGPGSAQVGDVVTVVAKVAQDGRPVANAPVAYTIAGPAPSAPPGGAAVTGADGTASLQFTAATAGDYTLTATATNPGVTTPTTTALPTTVPPTTVPSTTVPATTVPSTTVPPTTVPATTVPATTVLPTTTTPTVPVSTSLPATTVPATTVPPTTVPATTVPATTVPPTTVPPAPTASGSITVHVTNLAPPTVTVDGPSTAQTEEPVTVTATFSDAGHPVPGAPINFKVVGPSAWASFSEGQPSPATGSANTDPNGQASFTFSAGRAGDYTVAASFAAIPGQEASGTHTLHLAINTFHRADGLTLPGSDAKVQASVIDPAGHYLYFGSANQFNMVKVDLTTFQRMGSISLYVSGADNFESGVIDPQGKYAYVGTSSGLVEKVDLTTFTRVGSIGLTLTDPNGNLTNFGVGTTAVIDPAGRYAYFGGGTAGSTPTYAVAKVDLSTFSEVGSVDLASFPQSAVIDPAGRYAYAGENGNGDAGQIQRIDLTSFQLADTLQLLGAPETLVLSAVVDPSGNDAYFGTAWNLSAPNKGPGEVVKVDLASFSRVGALTMPPGYLTPWSAVMDPAGRDAYFGKAEDNEVAQVVRVDLATFQLAAVINLAPDEADLRTAVMAPDGQNAYFGTFEYLQQTGGQVTGGNYAARIVKVALTRPPASWLAAADHGYSTGYGTPLQVAARGVLAGAHDGADPDPLTAALATSPGHGTVSLAPDGSFSYTPAAGFSGTDRFTYTVSDAMDYSAPATVTVTVAAPPASVAAVTGVAYGYKADVSLFGGPSNLRGYGQQTCTSGSPPSGTPTGCVDSASATSSSSPSVALPTGGGNLSQAKADGATARFGPATIFGGEQLGDANPGPSGPLTVSAQGSTGSSWAVGASAAVDLFPSPVPVTCSTGASGCTDPGGVGPNTFVAARVAASCSDSQSGPAATASIVNGVVATSTDANGNPATTAAIPANPPPNYTVAGKVTNVGDSFHDVFNEQITNADGSFTVNAFHEYLDGPTAIGNLVVASATCGAGAAQRQPVADFDGDGKTDVAVFRPSTGAWLIQGQSPVSFGLAGDVPVPCDYSGVGHAQLAVFRPSTGGWYLDGQAAPTFLGLSGDIPVPADYSGAGRCQLAVFRPSTGGWYIDGQAAPTFLGLSGDIPVPADYAGSGHAQLAVYRPSTGGWYLQGQPAPTFLGLAGDIPVPAHYAGAASGAILAVYRPSTGGWYIDGQAAPSFLGLAGDIPVPGDYTGAGTDTIAVFRPSTGGWYLNSQPPVYFGLNGDQPLALPAAIQQSIH